MVSLGHNELTHLSLGQGVGHAIRDKSMNIFNWDQAALRSNISVCPSICLSICLSVCLSVRPSVCLSVRPFVRLSVCPSVRLSVRHTFLTMFLSSHHPEIFRSYCHWQTRCPCRRWRSKVKVTEVMTPFSHFRTVTPVWTHIWRWNDAQRLMLLRRGTLLFFKVIHQISRSHS